MVAVREYTVIHGQDEIGAVVVTTDHAAPVEGALTGAGYRLEPAIVDRGAETDGDAPAIELDRECTVEDHHPCDVKVAIAVATEVAAEAGLASYGSLAAIQDRGVVSEAEAEQTLRTWAAEVQSAPATTAEQRDWAAVVAEELWPSKKGV